MTSFKGSPKTTRWLASFAVLIVCVVLTSWVCAYAQTVGATLSGTLADSSGSVIPSAQVSIQNVATGVSRDVTSDHAGYYAAPNLLPGTYTITITAPGFKTEVRSDITLTVGAVQVLNISMQVGEISQKVEVTGEAPVVELASAALGNIVTSKTVVELPLNGRDWTQLATLEPGVNTIQTQAAGFSDVRGTRGWGAQLTVAGTRPQQNSYLIDGIRANDYMGGSPGSVLSFTLGVDAVGEFSVVTANSSAEYGRTSGGVINAVTKSGSNQFHGDAYWFLRDEGLDSKGAFDSVNPPFHRNQFGVSAGGPVAKERIFFFANYEGFRQDLGVTSVNNVPSANARNGIVSCGLLGPVVCPTGTAQPVTSCPSGYTDVVPGQSTTCVGNGVIPYLPLYPLPNAGLVGAGDVGHYNVVTSQIATEDFVTNRMDAKISAKDSLSGSWRYDRALADQPTSLDDVLNGNRYRSGLISLEETHIFRPSLVNTFRLGWDRAYPTQNLPISATDPLAGSTALGIVPGQAAPSLLVKGLASFLSLRGSTIQGQSGNSYQLYDDVFLTKGAHTILFGFSAENFRHNDSSQGNLATQWQFPGLLGLLQASPTSFRGPGVRTVLFRQYLFGAYVNDEWHVRPNLTLNLGLRYETANDVTEANNQLTNLHNITDPAPALGAPIVQNPTRRDFEPRIGFAWDPFRNGKTSVRGAFGLFDVLPTSAQFMALQVSAAPFVNTILASGLAPDSFPTIGTTLLSAGSNTPVSKLRYMAAEYHPHRSYVMVWNLNVQRQLTPDTTVTVGYVGNHGVHLYDIVDDGNVVLPTVTGPGLSGLMWPNPIGSGIKVNPLLGSIGVQDWQGSSVYDALLLSATKRLSHGFQGQVAYTFGKNLDDTSSATVADVYQNSISSPYWFCSSCQRALSDFNIKHNVTVSLVWNVPSPQNWGSVANHVLGGWEVGSIFTAHTGVPVTPLISGDPLGENSTDPIDFASRVTGPGCDSLVNPGSINYVKTQCFGLPMPPANLTLAAQCVPFSAVPGTCSNIPGNAGRNSIVGPSFWGLDLSFYKNNYFRKVSETFNIQFRGELFNILNHQNFATPFDNNTYFNPDGTPTPGAGTVDALVGTARQAQLALKVIW
jgi:hypothetical protein